MFNIPKLKNTIWLTCIPFRVDWKNLDLSFETASTRARLKDDAMQELAIFALRGME